MKSIKRLIALLLIVEGAIIVYCLTGQPTEEELADYKQARHDLVGMDNEIQSISSAHYADTHVLEHLQEVLAAREGNSRFLEIAVGDMPEEQPRTYSDPPPRYVAVTVVPGNDEEFRALQRNMKSSGGFEDVSIDGMDLDPDGFRTVQISARRAAR